MAEKRKDIPDNWAEKTRAANKAWEDSLVQDAVERTRPRETTTFDLERAAGVYDNETPLQKVWGWIVVAIIILVIVLITGGATT